MTDDPENPATKEAPLARTQGGNFVADVMVAIVDAQAEAKRQRQNARKREYLKAYRARMWRDTNPKETES